MSHWNYRVMRHTLSDDREWLAIHECYYDNEGDLHSWTENPMDVYGETEEELKNCYNMMAEAFTKPVLNYIMQEDKGEEDE